MIDEVLAPSAGLLPYGSYTPQYSAVLGWLLVPFKALQLSGETMMFIVVLLCNLLNLSVPLLITAISRILFPTFKRVATFSLFVALWTVCGNDLGYSVQIREFANFGRYVPSLLALWLVLLSLRERNEIRAKWRHVLSGCGLAIAILNSADFGLTLAVATVLSMAYGLLTKLITRTYLLLVLAGVALVASTYWILLFVTNQPFGISSYIGLRSDALLGNAYGADYQSLHFASSLLVMSIPVALAARAASQHSLRKHIQAPLEVQFATVLVALWSFALLVKFITQGSSLVGMPSFFVTTFLGGVLLAGGARADFDHRQPSSTRIHLLPLAFLICLTAGNLFPTSNVVVGDELRRISGRYLNLTDWSATPGRNSDGYSPEGLAVERNLLSEVDARSYSYLKRGLSVGYFGDFGNTVELVSGVDNLTGIPAPESLRFGENQRKLACVPVDRAMKDIVIAYDNTFPCEGYMQIDASADGFFLVFERLR